MFKSFISFLLFSFIFIFSTSINQVKAESELDSLESLLPFANDAQRVDILNGIALTLRSTDTTKAGSYARQAYALSNKINFCKGKATAAVIIGILLKNRNNFLQAQQMYLEGLALGLKCKEPYSVSLAYHSLGNLAYFKGDYPKALRYYIGSLKLSEQLKDYRRIAKTLNNIGSLYMELGNTTKAEEFYLRSLDLHKTMNDDLLTAEISNNLANIYQAQGYDLKALYHYLNALVVFREKGSAYDVSSALNNIGTIYCDRKQYRKALPFLWESNRIDESMNDRKSQVLVVGNLATCYQKLDKPDSAVYFANLALSLAKNYGVDHERITALTVLSKIYDGFGDKQKAEYYAKQAEDIKSNLTNRTKQAEVNSIQANYENEKKEARIKLLAKEKEIQDLKIREQELELESKNIILIAFAVALFLLLLLSGLVIYSFYINKQRKIFELSNKAKSHVLLQMNHEIRTPLNAIAGMSQLAMESKTFNELKEYLANIRMSSDELLFVLNNLIAYLQIDRNQSKAIPSPFHFIESLEESFKVFDLKAKAKNLMFTQMVYPGIPVMVNADKQKLNTILHNLISNAIQHSNKGTVRVEVKQNSKREKDGKMMVNIQFIVSDEGMGLTAKEIKSIFKGQFKNPDNPNGFGIGLKNVKDLCDILGGHIEVISEPGQGSSFIVEIELEELNENLASAFDSKNVKSATSGRSILIVEDNQLNQRLMAKILEKEGFEYRIASNGREALNMIREKSFALILMDIRMPEMDGIEATWHIRNDDIYYSDKQIPIIAVTAHDDSEEKSKCFQVGMNDYVTKPFNKDLLIHKINLLIQ
jgi:signal transduction histidine kinase/tetratricopeptide (TPR) repeat protein/ActR/RegA family two-component response regulator